jgi:hypothetical protein
MRSSGNTLRHVVWTPVLLAALLVWLGADLAAQSTQPARLYTEATAREATLRKELDDYRPGMTSEPLLRRIRVLVGSFEDLARLFPTSGYGDDALWRGGILAADAFWQFGQPIDRTTALELLDGLPSRYPASAFAKQVPAQVARLRNAKSGQPDTQAVTASPAKPTTPSAPGVALTAIRREVLPDALRITLELDREVPFRDERQALVARLHRASERARGRRAEGRDDHVHRRCGETDPGRPSDRLTDARSPRSDHAALIQRVRAVQPVSRHHRLRTLDSRRTAAGRTRCKLAGAAGCRPRRTRRNCCTAGCHQTCTD